MRTTRIYTTRTLKPGETIELESAQSHHVMRVLRLKSGSPLVIFNGDGYEYTARLESIHGKSVQVLVFERQQPLREPSLSIILGQGISRSERMDYTLQKSVELGITEITPLWTRRTQVKLDNGRIKKRMQHWQGVVCSASEQSGRLVVPPVRQPCELDIWCNSDHSHAMQLLLDPFANRTIGDLEPPSGSIRILIGPEGGLDEKETGLAKACGFTGIQLGPRILRTETAALAILSALQSRWGDFV